MGSRWHKDIHWPLVYSKALLAFLGILFVYSATHGSAGHYATKQFFWVIVGFLGFFAISLIGYRTFLSMAYLFYVMAILLLLWVLIAGQVRLGAQRWIHLGPLAIQPSEFAKLATVLALAHYLGSHHPWEGQKRVIFGALVMSFVPMLLVMKQPDLGSSLLFIPAVVVLLFLWGIRYRYLIWAGLISSIATPFFWLFLRPYQKKRILVFLNPQLDPLGAGYTALQSRIAVGSGGLVGKGFLMGTQSQLDFVPEHHTDFVFCVLGEEWGFVGALCLIALYGVLFRCIFQVIQHTTDPKARFLAGGVIAVLFAQVFINIGMTVGLMPVTGLTLPLVSYGGSSYLATSVALGLILSIHRERSIF